MKNIVLKVLTFVGIVLFLFSCNKEEVETPVTATISIVEPINNDTIAFNEEVHFEGTVSGSAEMHGYTVTFTNGTTSSVLYTKSYDIHANSYNFHEHWINNVTDTTIVKLKIDVTKDHDGNHEVKEVNVVCLPQ
ncbi:MAG: hypothetical protein ACK5B9_15275 [Flavobacteriia bacterium]|jgi:hypothetical protein